MKNHINSRQLPIVELQIIINVGAITKSDTEEPATTEVDPVKWNAKYKHCFLKGVLND